MKTLTILIVAIAMGSTALAGLDPDPDSFGVYFDPSGNTNCMTVAAFLPVPAYLVLMNPTAPVGGFECSVTMTGAPHFVLSTTFNSGCGTDPGWNTTPGDYLCTGVSDIPVPAAGAVVLVTWSIMLQAQAELLFYVGPASVPSIPGACPVLIRDGIPRCGGVSSGDSSLPVAGMNAFNCPVSESISSFGAVKSLYR